MLSMVRTRNSGASDSPGRCCSPGAPTSRTGVRRGPGWDEQRERRDAKRGGIGRLPSGEQDAVVQQGGRGPESP